MTDLEKENKDEEDDILAELKKLQDIDSDGGIEGE